MKRLLLSTKGLLILPCFAMAEEGGRTNPTLIDTGDTAWMIVATAFVMLMTMPGLAMFYGGLAKRKDALNTMAMSFASFALVSLVWVFYGYAFAFGEDLFSVIGSPSKLFLSGVTAKSVIESARTIPEVLFVLYQLTFASITCALVSGAFIERIKFSAWILFTLLWMTFVYIPVAHWVWGGGFLTKLGVLDFAGGTVVHINAGIAALTGVLILGKRRDVSLNPHNLTMAAVGTGLLWFGWFGFNAGSALSANGIAAMALINTNTAAACAAICWMGMEWMVVKRPTVLGFCSGAVAGLVAITPCAGFMNVYGTLVVGILAGVVPYLTIWKIKPRLGYDDTLDVFGIHGVAGILGAILTGIFADPSINEGASGLLFGNPGQILKQLLGTIVTIGYSGGVTALILYFIEAVKGLRPHTDDEVVGLDESLHGERAYNLHI